MNGGSGALSDEGLEVGGVPAGAHAAALQADGRLRLAQQVHGHVPDHGHVLGRVTGPEPGEVVPEHDVEHPVQPVLDAPVRPHGPGEGGGVERGRSGLRRRPPPAPQGSTDPDRRSVAPVMAPPAGPC
jgi:hypothetical protein